MEDTSLKTTVKVIVLVFLAVWLVTSIPNQPFMYDQTPICEVGTPTVKESKIVCVVARD